MMDFIEKRSKKKLANIKRSQVSEKRREITNSNEGLKAQVSVLGREECSPSHPETRFEFGERFNSVDCFRTNLPMNMITT